MILKINQPTKASVIFQLLIYMNSSAMSFVYLTLLFVCTHARRYDEAPIITIDQSLWCKVSIIVESAHLVTCIQFFYG